MGLGTLVMLLFVVVVVALISDCANLERYELILKLECANWEVYEFILKPDCAYEFFLSWTG